MKLSKAWPLAASLGVMPPVHFSDAPSAEEVAEAGDQKKVYKGPGYEKHEAINCGADSEWWRAKMALNLTRDEAWKVFSAPRDSEGDIVPESRFDEIVGDQKKLEQNSGKETVTFTMVLVDGGRDKSKWTLTGELGQYGSCAAYLRETSPGEETKAYKAVKLEYEDGKIDYFNGGASCEGFKKTEGVKCSVVDLNLSDDVKKGPEDKAEVAMGWAPPSEADYNATYSNVCAGEVPINDPGYLIYPYDQDGVKLDPIGKQLCDDLIKKARGSLKSMGIEAFMTQADLD